MAQGRRRQDPQQAQKPIESYPGQADADDRRNARNQDVIQGQLQGTIQGAIQGGIQSGIQGGIQGGVQGGVAGGSAPASAGDRKRDRDERRHTRWHRRRRSSAALRARANWQHRARGTRDNETTAAQRQGRRRTDDARRAGRDPRTVERADGGAEGYRQGSARDGDARARPDARPADVRPAGAALEGRERGRARAGGVRSRSAARRARRGAAERARSRMRTADVREQAVFALGQLRAASRDRRNHRGGARTAIPSVREQAVFALGQIRDRRAVEPLISALKDSNPERARAGGVRARPDARSEIDRSAGHRPEGRQRRRPGAGRRSRSARSRDPRAIDGLMVALKDPESVGPPAGGVRTRSNPVTTPPRPRLPIAAARHEVRSVVLVFLAGDRS